MKEKEKVILDLIMSLNKGGRLDSVECGISQYERLVMKGIINDQETFDMITARNDLEEKEDILKIIRKDLHDYFVGKCNALDLKSLQLEHYKEKFGPDKYSDLWTEVNNLIPLNKKDKAKYKSIFQILLKEYENL